MSSDKPNFLSQPVVKNVFMYRNGDPYYEARRVVINHKRVCNFETLLREVTAGIQPPFGAVRNIYTPRGGHKVDCLDSLQSGEQYVAAGRERFKKLDYLQIGSKKKRMLQTLPLQAKPLPQNRIIVSARFLKPIKEPCTIFVVANGDILDPAVRLLVHQRMLGQFDRILEMITEKMGLKILGGARSLYTYEGQQVTDGNQLESGQLYVAVGRERFKKLPYSDLLFTKPRGTRRVRGMKAYSLPPIYRFSKQSGNGKPVVRSIDSGEGESKASPPSQDGSNKEHLSSIVREISQARLLSFRKRKSGQSLTQGTSDNDDLESKADDGNTVGKTSQEEPAKEKLDADGASSAEESGEKAERKEEAPPADATKEEENDETQTNGGNEGEGEAATEGKVEEVAAESKEGDKSQEQGSSSTNSDKDQDSNEKEDGSHTSSEGEKVQEKSVEDKKDKGGSEEENDGKADANDADTGEKQEESENTEEAGKSQPDNETREKVIDETGSSGHQEENGSKAKEETSEVSTVNGEVSAEDEVESEAELNLEGNNSDASKEAAANGEKEEVDDKSTK
ncbi:doublecortin domain-containing protein 2-like [Salarias fasciatus]|uniref:doublecortin domain-containing protein 2-like n=1 Tax=Salarias fasciatus TaxID=181472 RepID=UPI001176C3E6|nr:doublecortin domain-containing protein 2 [Salarias fasciatus]